MLQTRLPIIEISSEKREELDKKLCEIYQSIKSRFKDFGTFQRILTDPSQHLHSIDTEDEQIPEEFTKQHIIKPLIDFLGFETISQTYLPSPSGKRLPDYVIRPKGKPTPIIYVEAESLNSDLYSKTEGVAQVNEWLLSRASKTDYGIATDGFTWIVLKFDTVSAQSKEFLKVDLRPVFLKLLNPMSFIVEEEIRNIEKKFLNLHCDYISSFFQGYLEIIEKEKEEISKKFYSDYVRYVFGYDKKGNSIKGVCLLNKLIKPLDADDRNTRLFAVVFMNRLVFLRFLEEKGIVPKNLLKTLFNKYKSSGMPATFYDTYLKPLFYEVLNRSQENRIPTVKASPTYSQIPYLNGGLFREIIEKERDYNIGNEGVELVIKNLLEKYSFGLESGIDPDILGYIFEKTINFISGTGTNQQKMKGAYYTPDDVVEFIIDEALAPVIYKKMIQGLKMAGWSGADLKGYASIEDILDPRNMPKNPIHIRKMVESIDTIKVLDPACGSGHFLTAMLSLLLRVKESLLRTIEKDVQRYKIKRDIISKNLFGVDIDENAVEIARLRLWLSIIEEVEVEDSEHIDTLPNIDFNILAGNSLVGWLDENLSKHPLISLLEDPYIEGTLDSLEVFFGNKISEVRELLTQMKLTDTIEAYKNLLELYSLESGERAVKIREVIEKIRDKLYEVINNSYLDFLHDESNFDKLTMLEEIRKGLIERAPFHWRIDFENVFAKGGFDVVVGNPPYIEDRNYPQADLRIIKCLKNKKKRKKKKPLLYHSKDCGNTHAYFTERSIKLLKKRGRFGFIVPISLVSTDRMDAIREYLHNSSFEVKYLNFDDRPGKIFSGLEHCRATIVVTEKGKGLENVTTSKYHRWHTKDRPGLFKNLKVIAWAPKNPKDIVPKIGTRIEKDILEKLTEKSKYKTVNDFVKNEGVNVWYHNAPQYWIHAHTENYLPKIEYFEKYEENKETGEIIPLELKETKISSHYKPLAFAENYVGLILGLLNSSLFYWWFVIWSNGRDLLTQHITKFPLDLSSFKKDLRKKIDSLVKELMISYDSNSNERINVRSGGYAIKITEIIPKHSKDIINQIDDIFAEHFGFSDQQISCIKDFDLNFRM
jgi:type I restriction-modification system DNA methylase subunit